jgi:hypothetical protein
VYRIGKVFSYGRTNAVKKVNLAAFHAKNAFHASKSTFCRKPLVGYVALTDITSIHFLGVFDV